MTTKKIEISNLQSLRQINISRQPTGSQCLTFSRHPLADPAVVNMVDLGFVPALSTRVVFRRAGCGPGAGRCARRAASIAARRRHVVQACSVDSHTSVRGQRLVVTTPLFYVNAPPHMGSAYPTMAADALARFYRMAGADAVFVTGCDEHGEKIADAAKAAGASADIQGFVDGIASEFKVLWDLLEIRYDRFVRTTSDKHKVVVKEFMERVWDNGDIYKSIYEGLYCTGCEEYKDAKDLLEDNVCPSHLTSCENRKEENYFFALSKYQQRLEEFLESNPDFVLPIERRNEVLGWVKSGLRDFSVSRANNPWGIAVPRDDAQTIYVWFDALLGYISALLEENDEASLEKALSHGWPADVHIIGKDILRFHAIYWPAMLMSAGLPLPKRVIGHGFITKDGLKMGKSLGNTISPSALVSTYGSDAVRYYFLRAVDFGRDGDFSEQRFVEIVNADLANSLGNLLNRTLNLLKKNCNSTLPLSSVDLGSAGCAEGEEKLRTIAEKSAVDAYRLYRELDFVGACESVMEISFVANTYINQVAPWAGFKSSDAKQVEAARRCVVNVLEASRIVAVGLKPIVPTVSRKVYDALGLGGEHDGIQWEEAMSWGRLEEGMCYGKPNPVFPRLEVGAPEPAGVA